MAKKHKLPFDSKGGVVAIQRRLINSPSYCPLSPQAKVLITLMQLHWRNDKPVDYSVREAEEKIPCSKPTAIKAFKELQEQGFIVMVDESFFSSRTQSKARTWRLTWMPFNGNTPTNEWEKIGHQNKV